MPARGAFQNQNVALNTLHNHFLERLSDMSVPRKIRPRQQPTSVPPPAAGRDRMALLRQSKCLDIFVRMHKTMQDVQRRRGRYSFPPQITCVSSKPSTKIPRQFDWMQECTSCVRQPSVRLVHQRRRRQQTLQTCACAHQFALSTCASPTRSRASARARLGLTIQKGTRILISLWDSLVFGRVPECPPEH